MEVLDALGAVSWYQNDGLEQEYFSDRQPAGAAISQEEATRRATAALEACGGNMQELVFERADEAQFAVPRRPPPIRGR